MNRLSHLKETLPVLLQTTEANAGVMGVVLDYGCREGTADWVRKSASNAIEQGRLVLVQVPTKDVAGFQAGRAKAIAHAVGQWYAEVLFSLDADNFLTVADAQEVAAVMDDHRQFVAHQYSGFPDTFGRICLPSKIYQACGGYDTSSRHYGVEDRGLIAQAMALPRMPLILLDGPSRLPITHSDEERLQFFVGHEPGLSRTDHIRMGGIRAQSGVVPLSDMSIMVHDHMGRRRAALSHQRMRWDE
jgi:hypothetical protein